MAGRAFLSRLVATRTANADAFYQCVKGLRQQFIADHLPAGSDGQVRSVAGRFGVVAAAGELATEWGILPWEIGEATQAAAICFQAWLTERGGIGAGEVQAAIRQVRAFFEQHGTSRFPEIRDGVAHPSSPSWRQKLNLDPPEDHIDEMRTLNRCGWRRHDKARAGSFYVLPEAWKSEVCRGMDGEVAAKALADRRLLKREGKNLTCKVTIPETRTPPRLCGQWCVAGRRRRLIQPAGRALPDLLPDLGRRELLDFSQLPDCPTCPTSSAGGRQWTLLPLPPPSSLHHQKKKSLYSKIGRAGRAP